MKKKFNLNFDFEEVIQYLEKNRSDFKICTKVRNEKELLPIWIKHLIDCGFNHNEIIIFDNSSEDSDFLAYLDKLSEQIPVITFTGDHNIVHSQHFRDVYKALAKGSRYFTFIDVDEFIYYIDLEKRVLTKENLKNQFLTYLVSFEDFDLFSLNWVQMDTIYSNSFAGFFEAFLAGKPLFNSKKIFRYLDLEKWFTNHFFQAFYLWSKDLKFYFRFMPFMLIHLKYLEPDRVIKINLYKINRIINLSLLDINKEEIVSNYLNIAKRVLDKKEELMELVIDHNKFEEKSYLSYNLNQIERALKIVENEGLYRYQEFIQIESTIFDCLLNVEFDVFPNMDYKEFLFYKTLIEGSKNYIEYGFGKTSLFASFKGKNIISIDFDQDLNLKIQEEIKTIEGFNILRNKIHFVFIRDNQIGELSCLSSNRQFEDIVKYLLTPWEVAIKANLKPDLIYINGQFRKSCFLLSLLFSERGTKILINDYYRSALNQTIEKFLKPTNIINELALFINDKEILPNIEFFKNFLLNLGT